MPILRNFASPPKITKKIGGLDLNFFGGTMENLWGWGSTMNQLTGATSQSSPVQASWTTDHKFKKIYNQLDSVTVMGIKENSPPDGGGTLWGWGNNDYGQLGDGTNTNRTSPVQIGARTDWLKVSLANNGYAHMLRTDGVLFGAGYNYTWRMLGDGTSTNRSSPVQIGTGFSDIMNGYSHSVACKTDGTLWAWGYGLAGSIGDGVNYTWEGNADPPFPSYTASPQYPVQIGSGGFNRAFANDISGAGAKSDGYLYGWAGGFGRGGTTPSQITTHGTGWSNCDFAQGSANQTVHAVIKSDGTLWMYGQNTYGQLGQGDTTSYSSPKQVGTNTNWFSAAVRNSSVFATTTDRKMFSWGYNNVGQLALGDTNDRSSPTQIGTQRRWGLIAATATGGLTMVLAAN
jgi:alpha-tubulin suppressor-like RCC1 family protein